MLTYPKPNFFNFLAIHKIWPIYSDLTRPHPKWWFSRGNPLISGKSRLVKYYNLPRIHKMVPPKSLTFYFQGVWRGEGTVMNDSPPVFFTETTNANFEIPESHLCLREMQVGEIL